MKRAKDLFPKITSDENLDLGITEVNASHRWTHDHKPNHTTLWVESTRKERIRELREIIENGFVPSEPNHRTIYDAAAGKWRDICEPKLWPDQYVHHALIQILQPIMMRNMDKWCCGSIKKRGTHYGAKAIKKWVKNDPKHTRYCAELDIKQFYNSIQPKFVLQRFRTLIKCGRTMDLIERLTKSGVLIGYYFSQWFANTLLQPLDRIIRDSGFCDHYIRYMDNFTVFGSSKRKLRKLFRSINAFLASVGLRIKENWQIFKLAKRIPNALGYRFGRGYTLLRKNTLLRLTRKLRSAYRIIDSKMRIPYKLVHGLVSRLGQLKHCNSKELRLRIVRQGFVKMLKNIIRKHSRTEVLQWTTALQKYMTRRFSRENTA